MKLFQFFLVCGAYIILALFSLKCGDAETVESSGVNCDEEKFESHEEEFIMQMGLCKKNLTVLCMIRPSHPCIPDEARFKVTAFVKGGLGRCLIEGNVTAKHTLKFFIEAKRMKNPNQAGSRSLGGDKERHQRGKCMLKYICAQNKVRSIAMDCGSVFETKNGRVENFTRRKANWRAPKGYKGPVFFSSQVLISAEQREFDISTAKIMIPDRKFWEKSDTSETSESVSESSEEEEEKDEE